MMASAPSPRVSPAWRWTTFGLAALLLLSWAFLGYSVLDTAISLDYCRVEQGHQRHDIDLLVRAAAGRLPSAAFLSAQADLDPELPQRLDEGRTLLLRTVTLKFRTDGLLEGAGRGDNAVEQ